MSADRGTGSAHSPDYWINRARARAADTITVRAPFAVNKADDGTYFVEYEDGPPGPFGAPDTASVWFAVGMTQEAAHELAVFLNAAYRAGYWADEAAPAALRASASATQERPGGEWTCKRCGFIGFWEGGPHCGPGSPSWIPPSSEVPR